MTRRTNRTIYEGACYVIECAVRSDGLTSPAADFLDQLSRGMWIEDPDFGEHFPDDAQISDYDKLLTFFQTLADRGEPCYGRAVNDLDDGIWEFKLGAKRLSFFDTPGDGTYYPKLRPRTADEASGGDYYWFPNFDEYVRLGHAFPKTGRQTTDRDLELTLVVREEDLEHDKR
ncbi:hypothetical protein [Asanoa hainanensis]|nr:hypothetical protein [Asanoa hainanensis]